MEHDTVDTPVKKKWGIKAYLLLVTVGIMLVSFTVELIAAVNESRGMNLELIIKLLDTLLTLLTSSAI